MTRLRGAAARAAAASAERRAEYSRLRDAGITEWDAAAKVGVRDSGRLRYEKAWRATASPDALAAALEEDVRIRAENSAIGLEVIVAAAAERRAELAGWRQHATSADTPLPGYLTARQAAQRLGVSRRTIVRYRARLRQEAPGA